MDSIMADSSSHSQNLDLTSNSPPRKRRKIGLQTTSHNQNPVEPVQTKWRTEAEQRVYSSKLVNAISHIRRTESVAKNGRIVRDAADRVLAVSAKGKTRWSRAILTGRLSLRLAHINKKHKKKVVKPVSSDPRLKKPVQKKVKPVQRKVKVLSRLVPGCRKVSLPNLLEETTDYIAALEMQVRAMSFLTGLLNGSNVTGATFELRD